jgi:hypothetical protein
MVDQNRDDQEMNEEQELERALALLRPAASSLDRDRFLFLMGRASAEVQPGAAVRRWMWPAATVVSSLCAVVLLVLLVTRTGPAASRGARLETLGKEPPVSALAPVAVESPAEPHVAVVEIARLAPTAEETSRALAPESNYPRLRSFVLAYGIDALPERAPMRKSESSSQADPEPATVRDLLIQTLKSRSKG